MVKRSRKKKAERADFAKVRLKVGRRLPKCLNETRVSLATGKILVRDQHLSLMTAEAESGQQDTQQQQPPPRMLLRKLRSSQLSERVSAASRLARWLTSPSGASPDAAGQLFAVTELAEYLAPCLREARSPELRAAAGQIFTGLLERGRLGNSAVYRPVLFQSIRACWTHLDESVQFESVQLLTALFDSAPAAVLDLAPRIRRLLASRLRLRLPTRAEAAANPGAGAASQSQLLRTRRQLMALAECAGRFAGLLAEARRAADLRDRREPERDDAGPAGRLGEFDLNEAAWAQRRADWLGTGERGDRPVQIETGGEDWPLDCWEEANCGGSGDEADGPRRRLPSGGADARDDAEDEEAEELEFESGLAALVKELLPAEFSGRVGGAAAFAEMLGLLRTLRNLLALHCCRCRCRGSGTCAPRSKIASLSSASSSSSSRLPAGHPAATPCGLAVSGLLAATLCPLFPLTVLSSAPSSGGQVAASGTKSQRRVRSKDGLKDAAARARELNALIVECALISAPQLESAGFSDPAASRAFVLSVYRFLGDCHSGRISPADSAYWLDPAERVILRHPECQLARLLLAFFSDCLAAGRFADPLPVAEFLTRVACRGLASSWGDVCGLLGYLPARLVQLFDSAQLHLTHLPSSGDIDNDDADGADRRLGTANSAVACLLELTALGFPGAAEAAAAASDRLVRYCPSRGLRRSLAAALAGAPA